MTTETDGEPMCEPFVCAFPPARDYRWRAYWTCPRCGTRYVRGRRAPHRWWRNWSAPHGSWVLPWWDWPHAVREMCRTVRGR